EEDLAYEVVEQMGGLESFEPSTLEQYFDYSAFGRDLAIRDYRQSSNGYVRKVGR
ncbi:antirestriction protein ArdA, partial [Lactococcus garvieae]|nr:antirestriction protein ArdA [Lactococcus garvieae]